MRSPPLESEATDTGTCQGPPDECIGTRLADGGAEQTAADDAQVVDDRRQSRDEEAPLHVLGSHEQRSRHEEDLGRQDDPGEADDGLQIGRRPERETANRASGSARIIIAAVIARIASPTNLNTVPKSAHSPFSSPASTRRASSGINVIERNPPPAGS